MDLLEYKGKHVLARYDLPLLAGMEASTVDVAVAAADEIGYPVVVKAQVKVGGRGKLGGIKIAENADEVRDRAQRIAQELTREHPDLVLWKMTKSLRPGKVFLDWSQNNGNKTTISPYSLRGRMLPTVAAPRSWAELDDPDLRQLRYDEVMERLEQGDDRGDREGRGRPAAPGNADL